MYILGPCNTMWLCEGLQMTYLEIVGIFHMPWVVPHGQSHVQPIVMNAVLCLLHFPVLLYEASPTFTLPNPTSSNNAKMKEVPTFAALRQFRVAEQVACHNSGKSLWLDLQANSWHGMVEWQRLRLTLSTQAQHGYEVVLLKDQSQLSPEAINGCYHTLDVH